MTTIAQFDADGYDDEGFDRNGFNRDGYGRDGYDAGGFNEFGLHRNGTEFDENFRTCDGSRFDSDGFDINGYDENGYNADGLDSRGHSRCDNGDCTDSDCERCNPPSDDDDDFCSRNGLGSYDECVLDATGWRFLMPRRYPAIAPLLGAELECVAVSDRADAIAELKPPFDRAYRPVTEGRMTEGCICKRDGSLPDRTGIEFVTVPMTLAEHIKVWNAAWPTGVIGNGEINAWNVSGYDVGMHVSLAGQSLSRLLIGKISVFINHQQNRMFNVAIAGRNCYEYAEFRDSAARVTRCAKNENYRYDDKYQAVHWKHHAGILEFRMFRASRKVSTVLKNLAYVAAVRHFCDESPARIPVLSVAPFCRWLAKPEHRKSYLPLHKWMLASNKREFAYYRSFFTA